MYFFPHAIIFFPLLEELIAFFSQILTRRASAIVITYEK